MDPAACARTGTPHLVHLTDERQHTLAHHRAHHRSKCGLDVSSACNHISLCNEHCKYRGYTANVVVTSWAAIWSTESGLDENFSTEVAACRSHSASSVMSTGRITRARGSLQTGRCAVARQPGARSSRTGAAASISSGTIAGIGGSVRMAFSPDLNTTSGSYFVGATAAPTSRSARSLKVARSQKLPFRCCRRG